MHDTLRQSSSHFLIISPAPKNWESLLFLLFCDPTVEAEFLKNCSNSMPRIQNIIIYRFFCFTFIYLLCMCRSKDNLLELDLGLEFRSQGLAANAFIAWTLLPVPSFLFLFSFLTLDLTLQHVHNDFLKNKGWSVMDPFNTHELTTGLGNFFVCLFEHTLLRTLGLTAPTWAHRAHRTCRFGCFLNPFEYKGKQFYNQGSDSTVFLDTASWKAWVWRSKDRH